MLRPLRPARDRGRVDRACRSRRFRRRRRRITPPDVLVKNVTLEVVDIIQKDKDIQDRRPRRRVIALIEAKVAAALQLRRA